MQKYEELSPVKRDYLVAERLGYTRELMGTWEETTEERKLRGLGEQYHQRCEAYDRTICKARHSKTGDAIPTDGYEFRAINSHALMVRDDIIRQGTHMGFTREQIVATIKRWGK